MLLGEGVGDWGLFDLCSIIEGKSNSCTQYSFMALGEGVGDWGLFDLCYLGRGRGTGDCLIYVTWGGGGGLGII